MRLSFWLGKLQSHNSFVCTQLLVPLTQGFFLKMPTPPANRGMRNLCFPWSTRVSNSQNRTHQNVKPSQQLLTATYILLICYVFCLVVNGTEEYRYEGPEFTVTESQFFRSLSLHPLIPLKSYHMEVCASSSIHTKSEIPLK